MSRREKIEAMLADDPGDTFLRYSLAMELDKEGQHDESLAKFRELTKDNPPYIAAYFMAGQQLTRRQRHRTECGRVKERATGEVTGGALAHGSFLLWRVAA